VEATVGGYEVPHNPSVVGSSPTRPTCENTIHRSVPWHGSWHGWGLQCVAAVAEATQTPPDLAGCIAVGALSTAAGGRARVQVRPGWVEPVNIYTVVAMPPGSRKSAVFAAMIAPLLVAEQQLVEATQPPRLVDAELAARVARARAERTAKAAENALSTEARDELLAEASAAALAAAGMTVPVLPRLIADDVTVEAAASLLAEQDGRLAVLSAEGGIFATLAGRYSAGQPNLEVFLKGHAGDLLRVDRKGRPAEHIPQPALTLGVAVQPEVLRDIARMPGFRGRGLLARILYSQPPNTVGRRRIGPNPVPQQVEVAYGQRLRDLVHTAAAWPEPLTVPLSAAADARVLQLEAELEPHLACEGSLGHIADWASKLTGATIRIAGLLHLAHDSETSGERPVDVPMVDAAARLGRYYLGHALGVFDAMGADPRIEDARMVLDWLTRNQSVAFTRRDLFYAVRGGRLVKVSDVDPPSLSLSSTATSGAPRRRLPDQLAGGRRPRATKSIPVPQNPHFPHNPDHRGFRGLCGFCAGSGNSRNSGACRRLRAQSRTPSAT
jgi:replicative DNA helicase